ncbi:(4Fe-4S)-binding protein [candidate division NPL-UPA2 bacterium Unc8]|uniref:(4Fe-4S)-binding protein n=1 Tax=candidate division NPL-UPA2 bacterium Unc8 TaxID=1980939 RepID=A0A399G0F4_UNCN2|nr:Anaerobic sulfite reductase subunit A [Bacillota bacterium]RII01002.1 MAG: (4Fe-4S)-binding protein [candidate division NPL-UPA2 bacterium Unc8]
MTAFSLPRNEADDFLVALIEKQSLFAPVEKDSIISYQLVANPGDALWNFSNSTVPPKGILFPQTETLFKFTGSEVSGGIELPPQEKETVIFGIRPCDGRAFKIVDHIFGWDYQDPYYLERRARTVLVGLSCYEPASNCFCTSLNGGPSSKEGLDMLLTDLGDRYYLEVLTDKGGKLLNKNRKLFALALDSDTKEKNSLSKKVESKLKRKVMSCDELQKKMGDLKEHKFWEETSLRCLGCGICTYLCPTCHCFDMQDEVTDGKGRRVRMWDSCMFREYTLHASGENPRPTRVERFKNRLYHKYKYYPDSFKITACVGCGRCTRYCPANLDLIDILTEIGKI